MASNYFDETSHLGWKTFDRIEFIVWIFCDWRVSNKMKYKTFFTNPNIRQIHNVLNLSFREYSQENFPNKIN